MLVAVVAAAPVGDPAGGLVQCSELWLSGSRSALSRCSCLSLGARAGALIATAAYRTSGGVSDG